MNDSLASVIYTARAALMCDAGEPHVGPDQIEGSDHGHTVCWVLGELVRVASRYEELLTRIKGARCETCGGTGEGFTGLVGECSPCDGTGRTPGIIDRLEAICNRQDFPPHDLEPVIATLREAVES